MKKILTASLVAIMAVTAANADIASTVYVDSAKSAAEATAAADAQSKADAALASAKTYAGNLDTAMDGRVDKLEADNTTNKNDISKLQQDVAGLAGDGQGSVADQISTKVGNLGEYSTVADAIAGAKTAAETTAATDAQSKADAALASAKTYADAAEADAVATAGTNADTKINTLKGEMTLATVGGENKYIVSVAQTDGKVTAVEGTIDTEVKANSTNLVTSGAVSNAISAANTGVQTLQKTVESQGTKIAGLETAVGVMQDEDSGVLATAKAYTDAEAAKRQVASTKLSLGAAGGTWTDLTTATGYSTSGTYSLVLKDGTIAWEKVVDSAPAAAAE